MSDKKIAVELTEAQWRMVVAQAWEAAMITGDTADAVRAITRALPPEYPEGMQADVTTGRRPESGFGVTTVHLGAVRRGGKWVTALNADGRGRGQLAEEMVVKVEPIRVLADDEIAVKRQAISDADLWREMSDSQSLGKNPAAAQIARDYADALDAEAQR